jgi:hypothetical protein
LAIYARQDKAGAGLTTSMCLPAPQYDIFAGVFAFSTCWRWGCLPAQFREPEPRKIKPYSIKLQNITRFNLDVMPGSSGRLQMLKPREANMSLTARGPGSSGGAVTGPYVNMDDIVMLPASISSFTIKIDVPAS